MTTPHLPAPHILMVEDEPAIAETLRFVLVQDAMHVTWCALAGAALAHLRAHPVDLVILDVGLPDANGFDVLKTIRRTNEVPIIMLTARGEELDRVVGLELGADDYVVKPFSPREVAARVKAVLKRRQPMGLDAIPIPIPIAVPTVQAPAIYAPQGAAVGGLVHDVQALCISFHGQELALTPSEYRLLATLMRRPGQVYTRGQLLEAMGDATLERFERAVDSHVKSLRAKLRAALEGAAGAPIAFVDPIATHRGFGYRLLVVPR
jgi:two-component system catabolic regulation response regulator CreB